MAICSSHRFCTCDVYTKHRKTSVDRNGLAGSKCSTHSDKKNDTNSIIESDSGSTICYGYSDNKCESYNTNCHPDTTGYAYDCPGHRSYDLSRTVSISNCAQNKIINNEQINTIQNELRAEIAERKAHLMYSSEYQIRYSESNVNEGNLVSDF